jgi:hypothetical protein
MRCRARFKNVLRLHASAVVSECSDVRDDGHVWKGLQWRFSYWAGWGDDHFCGSTVTSAQPIRFFKNAERAEGFTSSGNADVYLNISLLILSISTEMAS